MSLRHTLKHRQKTHYRVLQQLALSSSRPDMTFAVDWALKTSYMCSSMYLTSLKQDYSRSEQQCILTQRMRTDQPRDTLLQKVKAQLPS